MANAELHLMDHPLAHVLRECHELDVMVFGYSIKYLKAEIHLVAIHAME